MDEILVQVLVPIFICVVLPVAIVLIVFLAAMNSDNKRAQILIKAIEAGNGLDADRLAEALRKPRKSPHEILYLRLLRGCIFSLVGVALISVGLVNYACGTEFSADPVTVPMMIGAPCIAIDISYLIVYFVSRKEIKK